MGQTQIRVVEEGLQTTLQDLGRTTGRRYGIPPGGALDRAAHLAANKLALNSPQAATLEIVLQGPKLYFETPALIAITGADFAPRLNDRPVPLWMSVFVRAGQTLEWGSGVGGWGLEQKKGWGRVCYLAIHGGLDGPLFLGSRATYLKAHLSGYRGEGRALHTGDELVSGADAPKALKYVVEGAGRTIATHARPAYGERVCLRLLPGPYEEHFSPEAYQTLFGSEYTLTEESDRMGFRLSGPVLKHRNPELADIASCAPVFGAIQVPSNGQPIVLMADHQTTGGYPIIATVLSEDLPLLAQLLPGGKVSFVPHQLNL